MSETTPEVNTVFTVADQSTATLEKMSKASESLERASSKAKQAVAQVGSAPSGKTPETIAPGNRTHEQASGDQDKREKSEQEMFAADKEAMQLRKKRIRHEKLELAREQTLHRLGEMALLAVVGEENKLASGLAKSGSMMQGMGTSLAGLGGPIGKLGGSLASMGGYASMAGLAIEGLISVSSLFGFDIEKAGESAVEWGKEMLGIAAREKASAKSLGFKSDADMKAAEEIQKRWQAEASMASFLEKHERDLKPIQQDAIGGTEKYHDKLIELTKDAQNFSSALRGMPFESAMQKVEEAIKGGAQVWKDHASREAVLEEVEKNAALQLKAIPFEATGAAMVDHYEATEKYVNTLRAQDKISREEASAVFAGIEAQIEKHGAVQNEIDELKKSQELEVKMNDAVKQYTKLLRVANPRGTVDAQNAMNSQMRHLAEQAAHDIGITKGADMGQLLSKFKDSATEKQHKVFDFRGSRFDIKQAFSDMDPDRIAVAFSNDLAGLGERKVQSAFSPLWAV